MQRLRRRLRVWYLLALVAAAYRVEFAPSPWGIIAALLLLGVVADLAIFHRPTEEPPKDKNDEGHQPPTPL